MTRLDLLARLLWVDDPERRDRVREALQALPGGRRAYVDAVLERNEPVRGPLDSPVSLAHVRAVRRWARRWERKGMRRQASAAREDLARYGFGGAS